MQELTTSNELLGDRAALDAAWERDGYWFFRDVLPHEAVAKLRDTFIGVLKERGYIDPETREAVHNGCSLANYPEKFEELTERDAWKIISQHPAVHDFLTRVLGDQPFWIPVCEYRANPPQQDRERERFSFIHQDGFYNRGIPFRVCWIPLTEIDETLGGLTLAEGLHRSGFLNDMNNPPRFDIPKESIAPERWRRATYKPGDLLIFDINTPHSGLANYSDRRFRLSMDIRVMGASENTPAIGKITAIDAHSISVKGDDREGTFTLDVDTYARWRNGQRMKLEDIPQHFKIGDKVIVASKNGRATVVRPPH